MLTKFLTSKKLKNIALAGLMFAVMITSLGYTNFVYAQADINDNPELVRQWTGDADSFRTLARSMVNFALYFLGFIATVMIIYAGILYVTVGTDEGNVEKAKKIMTYAVAGIIVILLSFAIVNTVLQAGQPAAQPAF